MVKGYRVTPKISEVRDIAGPRCTCEMRDIAEHQGMSKVRDFVRIWMDHEIVSIKSCNTRKVAYSLFSLSLFALTNKRRALVRDHKSTLWHVITSKNKNVLQFINVSS